jgi:hypothetical protein
MIHKIKFHIVMWICRLILFFYIYLVAFNK